VLECKREERERACVKHEQQHAAQKGEKNRKMPKKKM
jgi:hypothetical protein